LNNILITGPRRSGTTFTGKIISLDKQTGYVNEPFNINYGLRGIRNFLYPYLTESNITEEEKEVLDNFFNLKKAEFKFVFNQRSFSRLDLLKNIIYNYTKDSFLTRLGKLIFQNKLNLNFLNAKYNSSYNNLLYKSPFSSLSSYYLAEKYNMKVVVLIRHPAAFYYSMKKRGWHMNPEDFLKQKTLIDDYLDSVDFDIFNFDSKIEKIINEWKVVYSVLFNYISESDNFIPVRHMV